MHKDRSCFCARVHTAAATYEELLTQLLGSTALSVRMDPEDLREVISAYQKCVAEILCSGSAAL